jgi:phosphopantothenate synthetase
MSTEITTGISIVSSIINLVKLISDMEKYSDKKFEKILKELRKYRIDQKTLVTILSEILRSQRCERIEVTRVLRLYEKKRLVIRNHFI